MGSTGPTGWLRTGLMYTIGPSVAVRGLEAIDRFESGRTSTTKRRMESPT